MNTSNYPEEAVVRSQEGFSHALKRQLEAETEHGQRLRSATAYEDTPTWWRDTLTTLNIVDQKGELRVSKPDTLVVVLEINTDNSPDLKFFNKKTNSVISKEELSDYTYRHTY